MQVQKHPLTNTQQMLKEPNQTIVQQPNEQRTNQETQPQISLPLPDSFQKQFEGGFCKLQRRNKSFRIHLHFHKTEDKSAKSIEELFTKKLQAQDIVFQIANDYMSKEMKSIFKKAQDIYEFLFKFIGTDKVTIDREKIHLILGEDKQLDIIFEEQIELEKQRNKVTIEIEMVQDKLYQFSNEEMQFLNSVSSILSINPESANTQNNQGFSQQNNLGIDFNMSQEEFLQKEETNTQEQSQEQLKNKLSKEEEKIQEFQQKFGQILNFVTKNIVIPQPIITKSSNLQEKFVPAPKTSLPQNPLFPPGYTPPHLAKPIAPDGFASDSGLKFQAHQSKKEKLRMSKQMLKLGYSVDEIIQRLKEIEIAQKTGKLQQGNAYVAPSQGPVRPFHIPRENHAPLNFAPQRNVQNIQPQRMGNEKKVRQRLIGLLKEKRYKKLQDIQKHMAGEGIETTVQILKGMIDDIRIKNAQRKSQNQ